MTTPSNNRVLVVDDSRLIRMVITDRLLEQGFEVLEAENGVQGLEMAMVHQPTVIISDVMMPRMDGFEFCKKIRENEATRDIFFIITTAIEDQQSRIKGLSAGCNEYLNKPVSAEELVLRIGAAVKMKSMQDAIKAQNEELAVLLAQLQEQQAVTDEEITTARNVQRHLLPENIPAIPGFQLNFLMEPSDMVGGDILDIIDLGENKFGFLLADVSGHGVGSAFMTGMIHAWIRSRLKHDTDPGDFLKQLNSYLYEHSPEEMYITLFLGILDSSTATIKFVLAGHPSPVIVEQGTASELDRDLTYGIVGIEENIEPVVGSYELKPGCGLIIFSDGLPDYLYSVSDEENILLTIIEQLTRQSGGGFSPEHLYQAVLETGNYQHSADDIAILSLFHDAD
ncbi:MAG TPA: response regulator [Bacteroidetes bacterium]|nr:response regulator [Bacteroidota bacterium]